MKRLNFYPFYEDYLRSREKTTTLRLNNRASLREGEEVIISVGWEEDKAIDLHAGIIRKVYPRRVKDLNETDLEGESPDCRSPETAKLVLSCIYKTVLNGSDEIWVVKFDHR